MSAEAKEKNKSFVHLLLTRFNIGLYNTKYKTKHGKRIDPELWMKERRILFQKYCRPSVFAQTEEKFSWIIVYDRETDFFEVGGTPIYGDNFRKASINTIKKYLLSKKEKPTHLITTRIDCDDFLHIKFIDRIQRWFERKGKTGIVTMPYGYIYNPEKQKLHSVKEEGNHFLTLVEKIKYDGGVPNFKTVLCRRHTDILSKFKVHKLERTAMWGEVIHSQNISNRIRGFKRNPNKVDWSKFGISQ